MSISLSFLFSTFNSSRIYLRVEEKYEDLVKLTKKSFKFNLRKEIDTIKMRKNKG